MDAKWTIALAHGAGAGMDTPFMNAFALGLADIDSFLQRLAAAEESAKTR